MQGKNFSFWLHCCRVNVALVWPRGLGWLCYKLSWSPQTGSSHKSLVCLDVAEQNAVACWLHHPQTFLLCRQTEADPVRVHWCPSDGPAPVFQMTSWPQTLEPPACHLVPFLWDWLIGMMVEELKHVGTSHSSSYLLKIGPAGQHRISDRLVQHNLGLVLFSLSASGRPGTHLHWSKVQVWGRAGLQEVLMVVWRGIQSRCGVFFSNLQ